MLVRGVVDNWVQQRKGDLRAGSIAAKLLNSTCDHSILWSEPSPPQHTPARRGFLLAIADPPAIAEVERVYRYVSSLVGAHADVAGGTMFAAYRGSLVPAERQRSDCNHSTNLKGTHSLERANHEAPATDREEAEDHYVAYVHRCSLHELHFQLLLQ